MESKVSESPKEVNAMRGPMRAPRTLWRRLTDSVFGRDIVLVLALKVGLIVALYVFLFRPASHPAQDPAATAAAVAGAATTTADEVPR